MRAWEREGKSREKSAAAGFDAMRAGSVTKLSPGQLKLRKADFRGCGPVWIPVAICLLLASPPLLAHPGHVGAKGFIAYRQKVMEALAADMAALTELFKQRLELLSPQVTAHADSLRDNSRLLWDLFPSDTQEGITDSKPEIWRSDGSLHPDFTRELSRLENESEVLAHQANLGFNLPEMINQMKLVGKACKTCHKAFRKPPKPSQ